MKNLFFPLLNNINIFSRITSVHSPALLSSRSPTLPCFPFFDAVLPANSAVGSFASAYLFPFSIPLFSTCTLPLRSHIQIFILKVTYYLLPFALSPVLIYNWEKPMFNILGLGLSVPYFAFKLIFYISQVISHILPIYDYFNTFFSIQRLIALVPTGVLKPFH